MSGKLSGKDTKEYVYVIVNAFTKFVLSHKKHFNASRAIKALTRAVAMFDSPVRVIIDQGRCFSSKEFREYCAAHNVKLHLIATGASRANGQVERIMGTLKNLLTAVESSKERSWQDTLDEIQLALNCSESGDWNESVRTIDCQIIKSYGY